MVILTIHIFLHKLVTHVDEIDEKHGIVVESRRTDGREKSEFRNKAFKSF